MNKKSISGSIICFLLLAVIVYATIIYRVPTACVDTDANCDFTNINNSDSINETVNLKTCAQIGEAGCNVTATTFNGTIPDNAIIENVTIHVKWSNDNDGAGNQYVGYYNGTWIDCAGPFSENSNTYVDTYCTSQQGNFSTVSSINNIQVRFRGNDTNGGAPAESRTDIIEVKVFYTVPGDVTYLVMMPTDYSVYNYTINATTEEIANQTAWISFNVSSYPASDVQPCTQGSFSNNQSGNTKPIFYIDNVGTLPINISLRFNETFPADITVSANASCTGSYDVCDVTKTLLSTTYFTPVTNLSETDSFANVSLWGDFGSQAQGGESLRYLFIRSRPTNTST